MGLGRTAPRTISLTANMPIMTGMKPTPPMSSVEPKVKRGSPATWSMPIEATQSPRSSDSAPLITDPRETMAA